MDLQNTTTDSQMSYNYALYGNHLSAKLLETYLETLKHQIGHPPTEFLALNNPLSQYCLVFLGFLNFMFKGKSSENT